MDTKWNMYGEQHRATVLDGDDYVILSLSSGMLSTSIAIPAKDAMQLSSQLGITAMDMLDRAEAHEQHMRQVGREGAEE